MYRVSVYSLCGEIIEHHKVKSNIMSKWICQGIKTSVRFCEVLVVVRFTLRFSKSSSIRSKGCLIHIEVYLLCLVVLHGSAGHNIDSRTAKCHHQNGV